MWGGYRPNIELSKNEVGHLHRPQKPAFFFPKPPPPLAHPMRGDSIPTGMVFLCLNIDFLSHPPPTLPPLKNVCLFWIKFNFHKQFFNEKAEPKTLEDYPDEPSEEGPKVSTFPYIFTRFVVDPFLFSKRNVIFT